MINDAAVAALIEKLERSAACERVLGNSTAAEVFDAKAAKLRRQYDVTPPETPETQQLRHWESLSPETLVVVEVLLPGMKRSVQRVHNMKTALPLLRDGAHFVRLESDHSATFRPQETGESLGLEEKKKEPIRWI